MYTPFVLPTIFSPIVTSIWFFLTTPLLVPPTKSQHFDSYLTQIFTLNSQIIVLSPKYPPAIFKIPKFTPFHPFLKLACQKLHTFISSNWIKNCPFFATTSPFFMPPPLGAGGIMFSGCPSVRPSVRPSVPPSVRPSEAWNTLFWPVHGSVGPPDQP